jgi:hypothetical protein
MTAAEILARIPRRQLQRRNGIILAAEQYGEGLRQMRLSSPAMETAIRDGESTIKQRCLAAGYTEAEAKDCGRIFKMHCLRWLLNTPAVSKGGMRQ